jgi:hypothetical protein
MLFQIHIFLKYLSPQALLYQKQNDNITFKKRSGQVK